MEQFRKYSETAVRTWNSDASLNEKRSCVSLVSLLVDSADENAKLIIIETIGLIDLLKDALEMEEAEDEIKTKAAASIWQLCIGVPENKAKCGRTLLYSLVSQLRKQQRKAPKRTAALFMYFASMAIWSICYGLAINQKHALDFGAIEALMEIMISSKQQQQATNTIEEEEDQEDQNETENERKALKCAITGALWHISALSGAQERIMTVSGSEFLNEIKEILDNNNNPQIETNKGEEAQLIACLLVGNLAQVNSIDCFQKLQQSGLLQSLDKFIKAHDVTLFNGNKHLLWTTLEPVRLLVDSKISEARKLGLFIAGLLSRTKTEMSKLFTDGIVAAITSNSLIFKNEDEQLFALFVLSNLGVPAPFVTMTMKKNEGTDEEILNNNNKDFGKWLSSIGLSKYQRLFEMQEVNTIQSLQLLNNDDLKLIGIPLGPRKQILSILHHNSTPSFCAPLTTPSTTTTTTTTTNNNNNNNSNSNSSNSCLICFEKPRIVCFVPCGHVISCKECSLILQARKDLCPLCRSTISTTVIPLFV